MRNNKVHIEIEHQHKKITATTTFSLNSQQMSTVSSSHRQQSLMEPSNKFERYHGYYFLSSAVIALFLIFVLLGVRTFDFERQFFERDPSFSSYDTNGEIVPDYMLAGLSIGLPLGCVLVFTILHHVTNSPYLQSNQTQFFKILCEHVYLAFIALLTSLLITALITEILKVLFSRPRPGFFYYCNYQGYRDGIKAGNLTQYYALTDPLRLGNEENCWDKQGKSDAMKSFPSGHSSTSFSAMSFISFYLLQLCYLNHKLQERASTNATHSIASWLKPYPHFITVRMLCFIPYIISTWIAVSRVIDYKHSELDVTVGAGIGILCSYFFVKQLKFYLYNSYNPCLTLTYPGADDVNYYKKTDNGQAGDVETPNVAAAVMTGDVVPVDDSKNGRLESNPNQSGDVDA
jgi:diacylglycerol diphosphate phosphatase/phosphatidate phosphatase